MHPGPIPSPSHICIVLQFETTTIQRQTLRPYSSFSSSSSSSSVVVLFSKKKKTPFIQSQSLQLTHLSSNLLPYLSSYLALQFELPTQTKAPSSISILSLCSHNMSSRRSSSSSSSSSRSSTMSEDEILTDLVLKLQALLPHLNPRQPSRGQASKVLKETCRYIRKLEKEVDDLSGRLSQLLDTIDSSTQDFDLDSIRSLLLQI